MDEGQDTRTEGDTRLMIDNIACENFKSYAGVRSLGPFHKNFTAIIGPNGSGKSNVIDAMLFVFGFRASKIRSKKVGVLVHNSDKHRDVRSCTVNVHFQRIVDLPGDGFDVVPSSQFVVGRTAFKDNSSYYTVNGKKMAFREVSVLLKEAGIDLDHNRFLILQGEVEQIALMKPKAQTEHEEGMLEYLEDIIGSSRFKEPIEQLERRVEGLNECRGEKLNRVKAVEKEKDSLEGARNEALNYIRTENAVAVKNHMLLQRYIYDCQQEEARASEVKAQQKEEMDKLTAVVQQCEKKKQDVTKSHEADLASYNLWLQAVETAASNFAACERKDLKLREDHKHARQDEKKARKALDKERDKLVELESLPETSQRDIKRFEEQLKSLNERKAEEDVKLQEVFAGLKDATQGLQMEKDKKEKVLGEKRDIANAAKTKLTLASEEMELLTKKQTQLQAQLEKAQESARTVEQTVEERKRSLKQLEKDLPATRSQLGKAEKELEMTIRQEEELTPKVTEMIAKVEQSRVSLSASQQQSSVLNALMEQKRTGRIKGIHGRLGDLGRIDDKYDVAISTACGALDYIVVETMDVAQQCVEFLKINGVGMATFIGMDKMQKWRSDASKRITTPQNVPRLFDLVQLKEPKFSTVFYYALRDTLVANDLDQATQIEYKGAKRYQVVTLKGEVIDMSGTMSGGGSRVIKGRMSSKFRCEVSADELREMERHLERDSQQLETLREQHFALEDKVNQLKKTVTEMESDMEKYNAEIQGLSVQVADLKKQIPSLEREVKDATPDQRKLKSLQSSIDKLDQEWKRTNADAASVEAEVQGLHQEIMEIGSTRLESQQARVDSISSEIDEVTRAITKAKVTIKTAERNLKKCQGKVASLEKNIASATEKISNLEDELKQLEGKARAVIEEGDKAKEEAAKYESSVTEMRRLMADVEKECSEAEAQLVDVRYALHASETRMKENQQKMKHWKKELGKVSVQSLALEGEENNEQLKVLSDEELQELDIEELQYKRAVIEEQLKDLKPNMAAVEEYKRKEKAYLARVSELEAVTHERDDVRRQYEDIRKQRLDEFMQGFTLISTKLKEMYQMLTLGGDAELELVDSLDPFSEGLVFSVRPPKKSWKNISNLSGGEKTLSSLALVFALHHYKPTPLYVMDEIDAALDFRNVSIVAHYIKERTKNAQFIIISLRNNMFELADRLVGIYKVADCTSSITVNPSTISAMPTPAKSTVVVA